MKPTPRDVQWLVAQLDDNKRRLRALENRKPGLAYSSIEDGAIREFDKDGVQGSQVGKQPDGTHGSVTLNGPKPPKPTDPIVTANPGQGEARWNGKFAGGVVSPLDLKHVAAYFVKAGEFLDLSKQAGVMTGELGDNVQAQLEAGVYNVYLVAWSKAGRFSDAAGPVPVLVPVAADVDAIQAALDDLDAKYDGVITEAGTLGTRLGTAEKGLVAHDARIEQAEEDVTAALAGEVGVERLHIGTGIINQLVSEHIAARTAAFQTVDVKNLFATTGTMSEAVIAKLFADVVMSRKITAQMMAIGSFDNLIANPDFADGLNGWPYVHASATVVPTGARSGGPALSFPGTGQDQVCYNFKQRVDPGSRFRLKAWVNPSVAPSGDYLWFGARFTRATGGATYPFIASPSTLAAGQWTQVGGVIEAPADAIFMEVRIGARTGWNTSGATMLVDYVSVTRMAQGELVVDGDIKAVKLDLEDLAANTGFIADLTSRIVKSDMFVGKEFHGGVFTGGVFQSPGGGAGFQLTENGYVSRDEAGNVTVRLPADGSPAQFKGDIEARSLSATGQVSLQALENEIASGAELIIRGGVSAPVSPLSVGESYDAVHFPDKASNEGSTGLAYAGGLWWRSVNTIGSHAGDRLEGINDTGQVATTFPIAIDPHYGVTAIGSNLYVMGRGHADPAGAVHVYVYSQTGTFVRKWQYNDYGTGTYQPGIGVAGTEILIAQCGADKKLTWRTYSPTTGALTSQVTGNTFPGVDVAGAYKGNADFGTAAVVIADTAGGNLYFNTTGTWQSALGWRSPNGEPIQGIAWDGTRFRSLSPSQKLYSYSKITDTIGDTYDWWVAGTWTGPGGAETTMGPPARFVLKRRAGLRITASGLPVGVTGAKIYLARKSTTPNRADLHLLGSTTSLALKLDALPASWASAVLPPASNTFPDTAPAKVSTVNQNFKVDGQGAGQWGPLRFNADGTMTSAATPDWIPITTYKAGFSPQTFGFVPAYRVWPDKKVEWRGTVRGTGTGFGIQIFTIPTEARPTQSVNLVGGASTASSGIMRIEFGATTNGQDAQVNPPSGTNFAWICLDGLYYYRE